MKMKTRWLLLVSAWRDTIREVGRQFNPPPPVPREWGPPMHFNCPCAVGLGDSFGRALGAWVCELSEEERLRLWSAGQVRGSWPALAALVVLLAGLLAVAA